MIVTLSLGKGGGGHKRYSIGTLEGVFACICSLRIFFFGRFELVNF